MTRSRSSISHRIGVTSRPVGSSRLFSTCTVPNGRRTEVAMSACGPLGEPPSWPITVPPPASAAPRAGQAPAPAAPQSTALRLPYRSTRTAWRGRVTDQGVAGRRARTLACRKGQETGDGEDVGNCDCRSHRWGHAKRPRAGARRSVVRLFQQRPCQLRVCDA
jgi:hypothetical protein